MESAVLCIADEILALRSSESGPARRGDGNNRAEASGAVAVQTQECKEAVGECAEARGLCDLQTLKRGGRRGILDEDLEARLLPAQQDVGEVVLRLCVLVQQEDARDPVRLQEGGGGEVLR